MTSYMTKYGVINVKETIYCGEKVRTMYMGGAGESSTFLDPARKYELVSQYTALFDKAFDINPEIQTVLMIGGGGYSYPKHLISQRPDVFMDVVEINRKCLDLSLRYFFLGDLIEEYDLNNTKRLAFIIGDGREFISKVRNESYDLIINDAFMGSEHETSLSAYSSAHNFSRILMPGGLYLMNIVGSVEGPDSEFLNNTCATLRRFFKHTYLIRTGSHDPVKVSNNLLIATDRTTDIPGGFEFIPREDARVIPD